MKFYRIAWICFFGIAFLGCGNDPIGKVSDKAPIVSIEKLSEKPVDKFHREISFKLIADLAPKTELLVILDTNMEGYSHMSSANRGCYFTGVAGDNWALIPKGTKESQTFSIRVDLNGFASVEINPIPTISIVGAEGEFVDKKKMDDLLSSSDLILNGSRIPEDFEFPYYKVGDPSKLILYRSKDAKIVGMDPPEGTQLKANMPITITFDTPPKCPSYTFVRGLDFRLTLTRLSPTTFRVNAPLEYLLDYKICFLKIRWEQPQKGRYSETSQSFAYLIPD